MDGKAAMQAMPRCLAGQLPAPCANLTESGEWHNYVSWNATGTICLPAGPQTLTMWAAGGWYNVRRMTFTFQGS